MATHLAPDFHTELPFAAVFRATDRHRLPTQLMASVWHNILQLPAQTRDTAEPAHTDLATLSLKNQRRPENLTDEEVRDGWRELANIVGDNLKALVPLVAASER